MNIVKTSQPNQSKQANFPAGASKQPQCWAGKFTSAVQGLDPAFISICNRLLTQSIANGYLYHAKSTKPWWYSVQKLHEEYNSTTIRNIQIGLAKDYIKGAQKNQIEAILRLIEKKRQCPKNN